MDDTKAKQLRSAAIYAERAFESVHDQVVRVGVSVLAVRDDSAITTEAMLGIAARTEEAINSAYAAIYQLRKVADQAKQHYRAETAKKEKADV